MFDTGFVEQIANAVFAKIRSERSKEPERWPEVMSIETVGKYLDRSPEAVRHLIAAKEVPTVQIDRRVQVRRVDIDRLVERNTT